MRKFYSYKLFNLDDGYSIGCKTQNTNYGFRHLATLFDKYGQEVAASKACYYNRTWESYEYESVINSVLKAAKKIELKVIVDKQAKDEIDHQFKFIGAVAKMGEIFSDTQKGANDWKARMLKAGLGNKGLELPEDWDTLTEDEKEARLNKVIKELA